MSPESSKKPAVTAGGNTDATVINAFAALADLRSHYQELIAQERYIHRAGEPRSIAGRQAVAGQLRRRLENLKILLDQLELIISKR